MIKVKENKNEKEIENILQKIAAKPFTGRKFLRKRKESELMDIYIRADRKLKGKKREKTKKRLQEYITKKMGRDVTKKIVLRLPWIEQLQKSETRDLQLPSSRE